MPSTEVSEIIKESVENLLANLDSLRKNYSAFLEEEEKKITTAVENLLELEKIEFSDDTGESASAVAMLKIIYGRDSEVVENEKS